MEAHHTTEGLQLQALKRREGVHLHRPSLSLRFEGLIALACVRLRVPAMHVCVVFPCPSLRTNPLYSREFKFI